MLSKKILSLLLVANLACGFSLSAGAVAVVSQDVLEIFNCSNGKELKDSFKSPGYLEFVNNYLGKLPDDLKLASDVSELRIHVSDYQNNLINGNYVLPDAIITEFTNVIANNKNFRSEFDEIIHGRTKHLSKDVNSRSARNKVKRCGWSSGGG